MGVRKEKLILHIREILEKKYLRKIWLPQLLTKILNSNYVDELQAPLPSLSVYRRNTLVYTSQIHFEEQAV